MYKLIVNDQLWQKHFRKISESFNVVWKKPDMLNISETVNCSLLLSWQDWTHLNLGSFLFNNKWIY